MHGLGQDGRRVLNGTLALCVGGLQVVVQLSKRCHKFAAFGRPMFAFPVQEDLSLIHI